MTDIPCEFCSSLINVNNIKRHQKTAKYCLKIQGIKTHYNCDACDYTCSRLESFKRHKESCIDLKVYIYEKQRRKLKKYKKQNKELRKLTNSVPQLKTRLSELEIQNNKLLRKNQELRELLANDEGQIKVYKEVVDKPRITNNTVNQINPKLADVPIGHIRPFTIETIREDVGNKKYSYEMFVNGVEGLSEFVSGIILDVNNQGEDGPERNYVCTDVSRNKFHRLLESKDWRRDNGAKFLSKLLSELKEDVNVYRDRIIARMSDPNTDEYDKEYADQLLKMTSDIYFGITRPKSAERTRIFKKLRSKIKNIASI